MLAEVEVGGQRTVGDPPAVRLERRGGEGDPVRVGVRPDHGVAEDQRGGPAAGGVGRVAGVRADPERHPRGAGNRHLLGEVHGNRQGVPGEEGAVRAPRRPGDRDPGHRRGADIGGGGVHPDEGLTDDPLEGEVGRKVERGGVAGGVHDGPGAHARPSLHPQRIGEDGDPVRVLDRRVAGGGGGHRPVEGQGTRPAARRPARGNGVAGQVEPEVRAGGDGYRFAELDEERDPVAGGEHPAGGAPRPRRPEPGNRRGDGVLRPAFHPEAAVVRYRVGAEAGPRVAVRAVPDRPAVAVERGGGDGDPVGVPVAVGHPVAEAQGGRPAAERVVGVAGGFADGEREARGPGNRYPLAESDHRFDEVAGGEDAARALPGPGEREPGNRRGGGVGPAPVHRRSAVGYGVLPEAERGGVPRGVGDGPAVQPQGRSAEADPVRVAVLRGHGVAEDQGGGPAAARVVGVAEDPADGEGRLRGPGDRRRFVELDGDLDVVAGDEDPSGAARPAADGYPGHRRPGRAAPHHEVGVGGDRVGAQVERGVVPGGVPDVAAAVKADPAGADPGRGGVEPAHLEDETQVTPPAADPEHVGGSGGRGQGGKDQFRNTLHGVHGDRLAVLDGEQDLVPVDEDAAGAGAGSRNRQPGDRRRRRVRRRAVHHRSGVVRDRVGAEAERRVVVRPVADGPAVQRERRGARGDPVRVGVPAGDGVAEDQRARPAAGGVGRVPGGGPHGEREPGGPGDRYRLAEGDRRFQHIAGDEDAVRALRRRRGAGEGRPGYRRDDGVRLAPVHHEVVVVGYGVGSEAERGGVPGGVGDPPAVQGQRRGADGDAVRIGVAGGDGVAEHQRVRPAAERVVGRPGGAPDGERQLRGPGNRYRFAEGNGRFDPVAGDEVAVRAVRAAGEGYPGYRRRGRVHSVPVQYEVGVVRDRVGAEVERRVVAGGVPEGGALPELEDAGADPVRVGVGRDHGVAEHQGTRPAAGNEYRDSRGVGDSQQGGAAPGLGYRFAERDGYGDLVPGDEDAVRAGAGSRKGYPGDRRGEPVRRRAVHREGGVVRDRVGPEAERRVVRVRVLRVVPGADEVLDRPAVQRERRGGDADAVRVGVAGVDGVAEDQFGGPAAGGVVRLPGGRADGERQLRGPGYPDRLVELHRRLDRVAGAEDPARAGPGAREGEPDHRRRHLIRVLPPQGEVPVARQRVRAEVERGGVPRGVQDRPAVQRERRGADAEAVPEPVPRLHDVAEHQRGRPAAGHIVRVARPPGVAFVAGERQPGRPGNRYRLAEGDRRFEHIPGDVVVPVVLLDAGQARADHRGPGRAGAPVHLEVGVVGYGVAPERQRRVVRGGRAVGDRPAVQREGRGGDRDPVRVGVRRDHRVAEHQRSRPAAGGVVRLFHRRADGERDLRGPGNRHDLVEARGYLDGVPGAEGAVVGRPGSRERNADHRRAARVGGGPVHREVAPVAQRVAAEGERGVVPGGVPDGGAGRSGERRGGDADPVGIGVPARDGVGERQRGRPAAGGVVRVAGVAADGERQLRRPGNGYRFAEGYGRFDPVAGDESAARAVRHPGEREAGYRRREGVAPVAVHREVPVGYGVRPEVERGGVPGGVGDRPAVQREGRSGYGDAVRVFVRRYHGVTERQRSRPAAGGIVRRFRRRPDGQRQLRGPGNRYRFAEGYGRPEPVAGDQDAAGSRPAPRKRQSGNGRAGGVRRAAVHGVVVVVGDRVGSEAERGGVPGGVGDRPAVQRERGGADGDAVGVGVPGGDGVAEGQRGRAAAGGVVGLAGGGADGEGRPRGPGNRGRFVEVHGYGDPVAGGEDAVRAGPGPGERDPGDPGAGEVLPVPLHPEAEVVRYRARTEREGFGGGGVAVGVGDGPAVQGERGGADGDAVGVGVAGGHGVGEAQGGRPAAGGVGGLAGGAADGEGQLRGPGNRGRPVELHGGSDLVTGDEDGAAGAAVPLPGERDPGYRRAGDRRGAAVHQEGGVVGDRVVTEAEARRAVLVGDAPAVQGQGGGADGDAVGVRVAGGHGVAEDQGGRPAAE